jgi:hypothetical protein
MYHPEFIYVYTMIADRKDSLHEKKILPIYTLQYSMGESIFFWIFYTTELDWQKNSKTKVEKAFFFIFMSVEMSYLGPKKLNKSLKRDFFLQIGRYCYYKNPSKS